MEKIVFIDKGASRVVLQRKPAFPHEWQEYSHTPPELVAERLRGATIAITNRAPIPAEAIAGASSTLRLIVAGATGYDHVDVAACNTHGVAACNTRGWAITVPEHVFSLILALRRNLLGYRQAVEEGQWQKSPNFGVLLDPLPRALTGSTLGIIGYGALAKQVATIGEAFGMNVLAAERKGASVVRPGRSSFEQVVTQSDILVLLCPLTEETRGMIGATELASLRPDALLINCARGGVVDEAALADALIQGKIGGAGVDVLQEEPPRNGSPLLDLNLPNLIVTPHVAWASQESLQIQAEQMIRNIEAFVAGNPRNIVTT
jgi:glycerate dehydrogenase